MTTTTTTTGPLQRPDDTPSLPSHRTWWIAAVAVSVAAATMGLVLTLDGSSTDRPAPARQVPAAVDEPAPIAATGATSADAAERRSVAATAARCSGLSVDAAERCLSAG